MPFFELCCPAQCVTCTVIVVVPVVKVKVHIAPLRSESPPQKRSGMARVLKGFHSFTCTPIGMSYTCLCAEQLKIISFFFFYVVSGGGT